MTDVTFVIGSGDNIKQFKCHRLIFGCQSQVFEKMWYGEFKEKMMK